MIIGPVDVDGFEVDAPVLPDGSSVGAGVENTGVRPELEVASIKVLTRSLWCEGETF